MKLFGNTGVFLLLLAVLVSAIAVVWARQASRELFVRLTQLQAQRDQLNVEFGRLELEQATWAEPTRIEAVARGKLGMINPPPGQIELIRR
jgi:cell division protein FtsL